MTAMDTGALWSIVHDPATARPEYDEARYRIAQIRGLQRRIEDARIWTARRMRTDNAATVSRLAAVLADPATGTGMFDETVRRIGLVVALDREEPGDGPNDATVAPFKAIMGDPGIDRERFDDLLHRIGDIQGVR